MQQDVLDSKTANPDPTSAGLSAPSADRALKALDPEAATTPAIRARIDAAKAAVDMGSQASILALGAHAQRNVAAFADTVLEKIMARETGQAHEQLTEIKLIVSGLDTASLKGGSGFIGKLLFNAKRAIAKFSDRFLTAREQVDRVAAKMEDEIHRNQQGLVVLDKLFEQTEIHFADLKIAIEAARELRTEWEMQIPALEAHVASNPDDHLAIQRVRDAKAAIELLDRKQMNLEKSRSIAFMHMPAIRQTQQTGLMLIQEFGMMLEHALPAWKTTMVINIEQLRQRVGLRALAAASDFTNSQITGMAKALEENTIAIHEQTARGIADVDAIVEAMGTLINTINKVDDLADQARKAREEGRDKLMDAQREFARHAGAA